nr:MAG TPA: minor capsid protein [Caudoviricetes sp.]
MEHNKYWAERFEQLNESELRKADDLSAEMVKEYRQIAQDLNDDIQRWYARFAAENKMSLAEARRELNARELAEFRWTVDEYIKNAKKDGLTGKYTQRLKNASARVHIDRLEAIRMQMAQYIERLAAKGNARLTDVLRDIYPDAHLRTAYEVQKKTGFDSFARIPEADVERILKKPWVSDGLNFSDRIWRDKERLLSTLQGELTRGLIRGDPYAKIAQRIAGRMNVATSAASRLVETEAAFFSSKGQLDAFRDLGVEQYEFVATLDSKTSETCRAMDGKVLPLSEFKPGITAPPLHCHCRSTTCPYFDDEFTENETRAARDPETGKTVQVDSKLSYEEWKRRYVDKLSEQKETDIMGKSHEKDVNPVHFVCKLDKSIYSVVSSDVQSGDVIITDERIGHIKDHHPNDYETFIGYIPQIIESPDYIVASQKPHTAVVLKMIEENGEKFKVILRLRVEGDPAYYKHSIISFWRIGDTTWRKTLKNKVILYSRR